MTTLASPPAGQTAPDAGRVYTADELFAFPAEWRYELLEGRLREMAPPAGDEHGSLTFDLGFEWATYLRANGHGGRCYAAETGFLLARNPDTVRAADFAYITPERLTFTPGPKFVPVAPDLALETRSPSDRGPAIQTKVREWLDAGVRVVLVLEPARKSLTVHRPGEESVTLGPDDTLEGYDVLPGFTLPLRRLFP